MFKFCKLESIVATDEFIRKKLTISRMCFAVTYINTWYFEPLLEQLEQVNSLISEFQKRKRKQHERLFYLNRFHQIRNGMHVEQPLNLYKIWSSVTFSMLDRMLNDFDNLFWNVYLTNNSKFERWLLLLYLDFINVASSKSISMIS